MATLDTTRFETSMADPNALENDLRSFYLTGSEEMVTLEDLPPELLGQGAAAGPALVREPSSARLADAERAMILRAMKAEHGNLAGAARLLGISRSTLYRKLGRYGVVVPGGA